MSTANPFNSALECGLRALAILASAYPASADLQRLVAYDYLLVHSADADGPSSLHPSTPHRNGELLVRHTLIESGLFLLLSRNLIERFATTKGIEYRAMDAAQAFLDGLSSDYMRALRDRADWVSVTFTMMSESELKDFVNAHFDQWTTEFQSLEAVGEVL
jgi:hypothetical protein